MIAILPYGTTVEQIARVPGFAPGLVSAGMGSVPVAQTYLDVSQGNRVNTRLYGRDLPRVFVREGRDGGDGRVPERVWERVVARADSAPAEIVPGLLASTLERAGIPVTVEEASGLATLIGVDRAGRVSIRPASTCELGCGDGLSVVRARRRELGRLARSIDPGELLIAIASGARTDQQLLPAGILGDGFAGNLTSPSTRRAGLVTATDIAPTVLEWLGVEIPEQMNGRPIVAEGEADAAAVAELQARLADRPRRDLVALLPLGVWLALAGLAALAGGRPAARLGLRLVGLAAAWAPLLLLLAAALAANELAAALIMGIGAAALAALTAVFVPGYRGFALACGATVVAHAVDVIAGSPYTSLSVLGPNPGGGVRFFGIGNELEAVLTTLTMLGAGAWLATRRRLGRRAAALWFVAIAALAAAAFAPGRFGADVGAAIVLAVGGATAAALALGWGGRRTAVGVAGAALAALAVLALVDLVAGGAHLSRSVLGAGDTGELLDVFERRLRLMVATFTDPVYPELLAATAIALVVGFLRRATVLGWFGDRWPARCGFVGALTGVLVGTLANDSGSVLLVIGTIYLAVGAGYFWAEARPPGREVRLSAPAEGGWRDGDAGSATSTMPGCESPSSRPTPGPIRGA